MFRAKAKKVALFIAAVSKDHVQKTEGEEEAGGGGAQSETGLNFL